MIKGDKERMPLSMYFSKRRPTAIIKRTKARRIHLLADKLKTTPKPEEN